LETIDRCRKGLEEIFEENKFTVFLCGPSSTDLSQKGALLRTKIKEALELEKFEVVLGEDAGLENLRTLFGADAQTNEKFFIQNHTNAVILIASSVGTYCELGLFSDHVINNCNRKVDFILILDEKHKNDRSYLNYGPAILVGNHGCVHYADLDSLDPEDIINRLINRRANFFMDGRGRPPGKKK